MTSFLIVARLTVTDPGERARRLALAFGVLERPLSQPASDAVQRQARGISTEMQNAVPATGAGQQRTDTSSPSQPEGASNANTH